MNQLLLIFILILFLGPSYSSANRINNKVRYEKTKEELVDELTFSCIQEISNKTGLVFFGFGGSINKGVKLISLSFKCYYPLSLVEAREILLYGVELVVSKANNSEKLRKHLKSYPFKSDNVEISIHFSSEPEALDTLKICIAKFYHNNFKFIVSNPVNGNLETIYQEKYEANALNSAISLDSLWLETRSQICNIERRYPYFLKDQDIWDINLLKKPNRSLK